MDLIISKSCFIQTDTFVSSTSSGKASEHIRCDIVPSSRNIISEVFYMHPYFSRVLQFWDYLYQQTSLRLEGTPFQQLHLSFLKSGRVYFLIFKFPKLSAWRSVGVTSKWPGCILWNLTLIIILPFNFFRAFVAKLLTALLRESCALHVNTSSLQTDTCVYSLMMMVNYQSWQL